MFSLSSLSCLTVTSPTNIACIKYWGKRDAGPNTPLNDSVSVTLHQDDLRTITSCACSPNFAEHMLWLNGEDCDISSDPTGRFFKVVNGVLALLCDGNDADDVSAATWSNMKFHISSRNTFPTAAGVASSAAGYAALTYGLACLILSVKSGKAVAKLENDLMVKLSGIARMGSGSACRSMFGGFVAWRAGISADGSDSLAEQIAPETHWPDLRALLLVVSDVKKETSSTSGMSTSVATSTLLSHRVSHVVPARMSAVEAAYKSKDFTEFGRLTMMDSNSFHACCADTYPPIFYMNDSSRLIVNMIHAYNDFFGKVVAAYTFDAGPNAVIYTTTGHLVPLLQLFLRYFPSQRDDFVSNGAIWRQTADHKVDGALADKIEHAVGRPPEIGVKEGAVKKIYCTSPGPGPRILLEKDNECLLDPETGLNTYCVE